MMDKYAKVAAVGRGFYKRAGVGDWFTQQVADTLPGHEKEHAAMIETKNRLNPSLPNPAAGPQASEARTAIAISGQNRYKNAERLWSTNDTNWRDRLRNTALAGLNYGSGVMHDIVGGVTDLVGGDGTFGAAALALTDDLYKTQQGSPKSDEEVNRSGAYGGTQLAPTGFGNAYKTDPASQALRWSRNVATGPRVKQGQSADTAQIEAFRGRRQKAYQVLDRGTILKQMQQASLKPVDPNSMETQVGNLVQKDLTDNALPNMIANPEKNIPAYANAFNKLYPNASKALYGGLSAIGGGLIAGMVARNGMGQQTPVVQQQAPLEKTPGFSMRYTNYQAMPEELRLS